MATLFVIIGSLLIILAVALAFKPLFPASLAAYCALWAFQLSGYLQLPSSTIIFWSLATLIVLGLDRLLPATVTRTSYGRGYIVIGVLAGMIVGMLLSGAGIIVGAAIGAFLGALAYSRTPAGRIIPFPSSAFMRFLAARGLPAIVTFSMIGLIMRDLLIIYGPMAS